MRLVAYLIDAALLLLLYPAALLFNLLTFFLASPLTVAALVVAPLAYHSLMIGAFGGATLGMRVVGLRAVDAESRRPPSLIQAFIMTVLFYGSLSLSAIPLIWCLFDKQGRFLHDIFSGVRVITGKAEQGL
ncbi:MAG: RDD family protein [Alphaproteobacteria bacterium]|nr:RDD family protein [Alphaproteobacteria bacterium]